MHHKPTMCDNDPPHCQQLLTGCFSVPCVKPDVEEIIETKIKPVICSVQVIPNKIVFEGYVEVDVEYVADVPEYTQPVHFASFRKTFSGFIDCPCAYPGLEAILDGVIEYDEFDIAYGRDLYYTIVINIFLAKLEPLPGYRFTAQSDCDPLEEMEDQHYGQGENAGYPNPITSIPIDGRRGVR